MVQVWPPLLVVLVVVVATTRAVQLGYSYELESWGGKQYRPPRSRNPPSLLTTLLSSVRRLGRSPHCLNIL